MANVLHLVALGKELSSAQELTDYFCEMCGHRMLPWMKKEFDLLLKAGFCPEVLVEIIDRTSRAPRPSWAYLSAIVDKARYYQAFSMEDFLLMPRRGSYEDPLPY